MGRNHDKSYYPVTDTSMLFSAVSTMALPAVQTMAKEGEVVMKDWIENFRPVRQRTVRSETTLHTVYFHCNDYVIDIVPCSNNDRFLRVNKILLQNCTKKTVTK